MRNGRARVATPARPPVVGSLPAAAVAGCLSCGRSRSALHRTRWLGVNRGFACKEGSTKMSKHSMICAGIDTGKRKLDVANWRAFRMSSRSTIYRTVTLPCRAGYGGTGSSGSGSRRVAVMEQAVVAQLRRDGFEVVVFQPAQVRAYAGFQLQRAKNDKIDAALIADCTAATQQIHAPPDLAFGAICQASDANRADHRGRCASQEPPRGAVVDSAYRAPLERGDCPSQQDSPAGAASSWSRRSANILISPSRSST